MSPVINAVLGIAFLGVGAAATFLMLALQGRPLRTGKGKPTQPDKDQTEAPKEPPGETVKGTTVPEEPVVADTKPVKVALEQGEHYWCSCGRSQAQPFCDGSHRGTPFQPLAFTVETQKTAVLCLCKHTKKPPYCDGAHRQLKPNAAAPEPKSAASSAAPRSDHPSSPQARNTPEEPNLEWIDAFARHGLAKMGRHGVLGAMGVPPSKLPRWEDIQILTAQLATKPLLETTDVGTELVIGPNAKKPLRLQIPLFVSDMSFGALSREAKVALATGAEMAGTGICSGEGGMLPAEQAANSRYLYELASGMFGYGEEILSQIQAFHFKAGQAAKTGIGGHLPSNKVTGEIAEVRHVPKGRPAISPPAFSTLTTPDEYAQFADRVREVTGGIPIGMKMSAQHIEDDLAFALQAGVDYVILDGRGGATGAAPLLFRDNISVPTIPALARARRYLESQGRSDITLIITGGLRTPADFIKALCLGADGIAIANAAIQAIGCIGARICHTNNCPSGIATQREDLRARLDIEDSAARLARFLESSTQLMATMARACGHRHLHAFTRNDLTTWKKQVADLTDITM